MKKAARKLRFKERFTLFQEEKTEETKKEETQEETAAEEEKKDEEETAPTEEVSKLQQSFNFFRSRAY